MNIRLTINSHQWHWYLRPLGQTFFLQLLFIFQIEKSSFSAFWMKKAQRYLCYFQPATNQIDHKAGKQNSDQAISPSDGFTCKQGTTKAELSTQCTFAIKMLSKWLISKYLIRRASCLKGRPNNLSCSSYSMGQGSESLFICSLTWCQKMKVQLFQISYCTSEPAASKSQIANCHLQQSRRKFGKALKLQKSSLHSCQNGFVRQNSNSRSHLL